MSSLIPGYNYDIFISYRQKDNKHDGWVTEFVENFKGELESTFKEEISVYFDINPHDGLLETHDVDESLKDKLKCLIFIPVISQTYCDPNSFAWKHEFKAFIYQASKDQFGLKVKLPGGNVANRVLPVQIHDLDAEDKKLVEKEFGGHLRGVEFIYKESGVNRPLKPTDKEEKNLNATKYENQINKVANAVKEIITSLKRQDQHPEEGSMQEAEVQPVQQRSKKSLIIALSLILLLLIVPGIFFIPKLSKSSEELEKSIAVLPFINDSPSDSNEYFINGLMEEIITNLQKIKDFRVLSRTSTAQYKGINRPIMPEIAKKLGVNYIVEGSGQKYGNSYRLRVQLIAGNKEKHLWAESYEKEIKEPKDIYGTQSEIAQSIARSLKATITPEEKQLIEKIPTLNLKALDFYQRGRDEQCKYWLNNNNKKALQNATLYYKMALKCDSSFAQAYTGLAIARIYSYWTNVYSKIVFQENDMRILKDSVISLADKALYYNKNLDEAYIVKGWSTTNTEMALKEYKTALNVNPNYGLAYNAIANVLYDNSEYTDAIAYRLKSIELEKGPLLPLFLNNLGFLYENLGFPENAVDIYNQIFQLTKDSLRYYRNMSGPFYAVENWDESIKWANKILEKNANDNWAHFQLASIFLYLGKDDSLNFHIIKNPEFDYLNYEMELFKGYLLWKKGDEGKANIIFEKFMDFSEKLIKSGYNKEEGLKISAQIYSLKGEQKKAIECLEKIDIFKKQKWYIIDLERNPLYNNLRSNNKFQEILSETKLNWQREHNKLRAWLEENKLLKN
jgi:TolB-like protein